MDYLCDRCPAEGAGTGFMSILHCVSDFSGEGGARNRGEGPCGAPLTRRGGLLFRPSVPSGRPVCLFFGRFSCVSRPIGYCYLFGHNLLDVLSVFPEAFVSVFFSVVCTVFHLFCCDFCNTDCDFCNDAGVPWLRLLQCRGYGLRLLQ